VKVLQIYKTNKTFQKKFLFHLHDDKRKQAPFFQLTQLVLQTEDLSRRLQKAK